VSDELAALVERRRRTGRMVPSWADRPRSEWPALQTVDQRIECERLQQETQARAAEQRRSKRRQPKQPKLGQARFGIRGKALKRRG